MSEDIEKLAEDANEMKDDLIFLLSRTVTKYADSIDDDNRSGLAFLLAVEMAYMFGAAVTAHTHKEEEENFLALAKALFNETSKDEDDV